MSDDEQKRLQKIIGHEINNPLMVMQISMNKLKANYPGIENDKSFIYIQKSAERIHRAVGMITQVEETVSE